MRYLRRLLPLAAALCLLLSACGGGAGGEFDPEKATRAVLDSGAFSLELDELDADLLYDFQGYGVEDGTVTAAKAYAASGLAEQVSVLVCRDETAAQDIAAMLETYLADLTESYRDYAPAEVPKLEKAILERRGATVLLVVANDPETARKTVNGL